MDDDLSDARVVESSWQDDGIVNPYQSPETSGPMIDIEVGDSPLVKKLRRKTGNDLIWCAVVASAIAFFIPFGIVLDAVSLFLISRTFVSRSRPDAVAIVFGVIVGLWNLIRVGFTLLGLAIALLLGG